MKKIYLTMLALLAFASSNAQSTDPEWAAQEMAAVFASSTDVVALKSSEFPKGSGEVKIPICVKAHADFQGTTFYIQLPEGLSMTLDPVVNTRTANMATGGSTFHTEQLQSDGTHMVLSSISGSTSSGGKAYYTKGEASDDYLFAYISVNVSSLVPGDYPMKIVTETIIADFADGSEDVIHTDEIITTTTLKITNEVILDENDTEWPDTYTNVDVKVLRTISAGNWNTICLPFDMSEEQCKAVFGDDVELAAFNGYLINDAKDFINVRFTPITSITKNVPCIIKVSKAIAHDDGFTLKNINIEPAAAKDLRVQKGSGYMVGTYKNNTKLVLVNEFDEVTTQYIFLSGNNFYYATAQTKPMKGFRAYFNFRDVAKDFTSDVKFIFTPDDEPTSIDGMASAEKIKGVYTVSGVKVAEDSLEGLPKGVYIVNGKKVLVK